MAADGRRHHNVVRGTELDDRTSAKLTTSGAFSERTGTQRTAVRGRAGLEKTAVRGPEPLPPLSRGLE